MTSRIYDSTSMTLLARVQAQQSDAWDRLVELYAPLVRHWCRRSSLSPEDTADVFQDVFKSVAESIAGFHRDRPGDTFRGWLRTITVNKIRDLARRQQSSAAAEGGTGAQLRLASTPDPLFEDDEPSELKILRQSVHRVLESIRGDFEQRTWQAFWKSQVEEHATQDIATELNMTPAAVRKAKYRVLRRLREEIEGLVEFPC